MIKWVFLTAVITILFGCSSKPKATYDVTTLQSISYALMDLADQKRQQENYQQALLLYQEADKYSGRRNDKYLLGLSKLKQTAIHIKTADFQLAETRLDEVTAIASYEEARLQVPLMFIKAEYWANTQNLAKSKDMYIQLIEEFQSDPIRSAYYQMGWWQYEPSFLTSEKAAELVARVAKAKSEGTLENIEIYSFVLLKYAEYELHSGNTGAEAVGLDAVKHFTKLEQSRKVQRLYELLAVYAKDKSEISKANYYDAQAVRIKELLE